MKKDKDEPPIKFLEGFEPSNRQDWETLVDSALSGKSIDVLYERETYEGFSLQPIYQRDEVKLLDPSSTENSAISKIREHLHDSRKKATWKIGQYYSSRSVREGNKELKEDLDGGVGSISLVVKPLDGIPSEEGIDINCLSDVESLFDGIDLKGIEVQLLPSHSSLPVAAIFAAYFEKNKFGKDVINGNFGVDPLGNLAKTGQPFGSLRHELTSGCELASWAVVNMSAMRSFLVDTSIFYEGGVSETQDLAFSMAIAVEYLRAMTANGLSLNEALQQISFTVPIGTNVFYTIAKLRAFRLLWGRIVESCGGLIEFNSPVLNANISKRVLSGRDVSVNMLRASCACFSAVAGGADTVTLFAHTHIVGSPSSFDRRVVRNIQNVLKQESFISNVADPAGGSFYVENLTDTFALKSWQIFQSIEREGGFCQKLLSGSIYEMVEEAWKKRKINIDNRRDSVTGVSSFPNLHEKLEPGLVRTEKKLKAETKNILSPADVNPNGNFDNIHKAAALGADLSVLIRFLGKRTKFIKPIQPHRLSEDFETLRDLSDCWLAQKGRRPRGLIVRLGKPADYTARVVFAKNYMAIGGIETQEIDGDSTSVEKTIKEENIDLLIICSSDRVYEETLESNIVSLRSMTSKMIVLAGGPRAEESSLYELGLDKLIYSGDKILDTLQEIAEEIGLIKP